MAVGAPDTARLRDKNSAAAMAARVADRLRHSRPRSRAPKRSLPRCSRLMTIALFEKVLVWFQAQHTIPSPYVLGNIKNPVEGMDNLAVADMLGWPSDFRAWGRLIDWIISEADAIPVRLIPKVLEVFDVWQNALSDHKNGRSKAILQLANAWLMRFEKGELQRQI